MFLARVLTGLTTRGNPNYRRPPQNPKTKRLFDSVDGLMNGDPTNETFVIFDPMQHYPEYLIEFGVASKSQSKKKQKAQVAKKSTATPAAALQTPAPPAPAPPTTPAAANPYLQLNAIFQMAQMPPMPAMPPMPPMPPMPQPQMMGHWPPQGHFQPPISAQSMGLVSPASPAVIQAFSNASPSPRRRKRRRRRSRTSSP